MCDLRDGFKLCTCDGEALVEPDWTLSRWDRTQPVLLKMGSMVGPRPWSDRDQARIEVALAALGTGECFDFEYVPEEGDVLVLAAMEGRSLRFRYTGGWTLDESDMFTPWRDQMVETRQGRLQLVGDVGDPAEIPVLKALLERLDDVDRRQVAIDWLHENGHGDLAEWLRMEARAHAGEPVEGFRAVAERVGRRLRARFGRTTIQGCRHRGCPKSWQALPAGSDELARECGRCGLEVRFVDHTDDYATNGRHVLAPSLATPGPGMIRSLIQLVWGEG